MPQGDDCAIHSVWGFCSSFNCFINWLDHWQTMLTGAGAIVAAVVSIHYAKKQISETAIQENARRARRFTASRARLPLLLSDTIQYSFEAMELLKKYLDTNSGPDIAYKALSNVPRPVLPDSAIIAFEAIIENADDDKFVNVIADMISQMQVLNSRMRSLPSERRALGPQGLQSYLMNSAKIYGYAASMYAFARRETDQPPHFLDWDVAISGLNLRNIGPDEYPDLHAFMGRARDRDNLENQPQH